MSLLVALAGTEGQFQFPLLMSVGLCMCAFWCVYVCVLLLGVFFVVVFFFFLLVCFGFFFFFNKEKVYIFGKDRNVVQIYFCLCCSTVVPHSHPP